MNELYRQWLAASAQHDDWSADNQERLVEDTWITLTSEPGGVDYVEVDAGGPLPALWAIPKDAPEDTVLFAVHGGGFITGSVYTHRKLYGHLAKAMGVRALLPSYRLIHKGGQFPVPVDEVFGAYRWLLDQGADAKRVVFAGDSVGGNLALAVQLKAKDQGVPLPAASLLMSPVTDHTRSTESMTSNRDPDRAGADVRAGRLGRDAHPGGAAVSARRLRGGAGGRRGARSRGQAAAGAARLVSRV
ncbi:alpha/beta hydrolase fold domain-containing protein [Nonomuraea aurantiaca]|uniref:alpha/beta hydrolase fold domain-containing protein n=1 Tax=Nonomuraea aurantiaca TaxID=2878562 RepID=UPI001CD9B12F|nr:alpha/beta hydrolase [Nonomuraea aurantiaca]MCA2230024.1 alpha/beta hydrolase [Nonomuraea aurantiaca]